MFYVVDADIKENKIDLREHLRRLFEVAHIFMDAGSILMDMASELFQEDLEIIKNAVNPEKIEVV